MTATALDRSPRATRIGVAVATTIIVAWLGGLVALLALDATRWPLGAQALAVAAMTWLSTGLFITAHDAMHGTVAPTHRRWNDRIGALALGLYALFPYRTLLHAHRAHHRAPGTGDDPDFHAPGAPHPVRWYLRFVGEYLSVWQIVGMAVIFNVLLHGVGLTERALLTFWVAPLLLSTMQLFVVGTWLPHRADGPTPVDDHHARSLALPPWASLLACYHFGYHREHHAWPHVPWWRLPAARSTRPLDPAGTAS